MVKVLKKNKFLYYIHSYLMYCVSVKEYQEQIRTLETKLANHQLREVEERVKYYNQLDKSDFPFSTSHKIKDLKKPKSPTTYYHDTYEYARFFDENFGLNFTFGDVVHVPEIPSIVKSRPVGDHNKNSVLLNLDKARHFIWVKDNRPFHEKKNMLIGRGAIYQEHRCRFYEKFFRHPLCNLGQVNKTGAKPDEWLKPKISFAGHLEYKFILCLQGNDVASNLKWVMSSNSIAVMPKPTLETWFMEGKLEGGKHYIEIKDDYSDLEDQLNYYISNVDECLKIIRNANAFCTQFYHQDIEDLCSLKVLEKYFARFISEKTV